jgi:hypothetical protein
MASNDIPSTTNSYSQAIVILLKEGLIEPAEMIMDLKNISIPDPDSVFIELVRKRITDINFDRIFADNDTDQHKNITHQKYHGTMLFILSRCNVSQKSLQTALKMICKRGENNRMKETLDMLISGGLDLTNEHNVKIIFNSASVEALDYLIDHHYVTLEYLNQLIIIDGEFLPLLQSVWGRFDFIDRCLQIHCIGNPYPILTINKLFINFMANWTSSYDEDITKFIDAFVKNSVQVYLTQQIIDTFNRLYAGRNPVDELMRIAVAKPDEELSHRRSKICTDFQAHGVTVRFIKITPALVSDDESSSIEEFDSPIYVHRSPSISPKKLKKKMKY